MSDKVTRSMDTNVLALDTVIKEVQQLINEGRNSQEILNIARNKYGDDSVVDSIMEHFAERRQKAVKVATIFLNAFERKYKNDFQSMSLSKFMKRALKYKKRYELSDDEFDEIRRMFEMRVFNSHNNLASHSVIYPNTNISRALGYPIVETTEPIKPSTTDEYSSLQDILKLYQLYRPIHSHIVLQTMLYKDLAVEAVNGKFDQNKHDVNRYVHPVLAAFFLPKFPEVEERMLYANIAGIINTRYNKERIITKPDYELFYSMVVDPTDAVCDNASPIKDIKSRSEVQIQLWNNVYNLRNGKFYEGNSFEFITYIDKCRISNVDNPDVMYLSDEGVILRRLFAVFAFRPIIVQTQPVFGMIVSNPLNLPVNTSSITSIPYITYKLPAVLVQGQTYSLSDANSQIQFYMENGSFVPKATQIIRCNGPIVFYVPRRSISLPVRVANPQLSPFGFAELMSSTRHYHNINGIEIEYQQTIDLTEHYTNLVHSYYLRSAVVLEKYHQHNIILGHMTYLFQYERDPDNKIITAVPSSISVYVPRRANTVDSAGWPILASSAEDAKNTISRCGTIYVYSRV